MTGYEIPGALLLLVLGAALTMLPAVGAPTLVFGVRVPAERRTDPVVRRATRGFQVGVGAATVVLLVLGLLVSWPAGLRPAVFSLLVLPVVAVAVLCYAVAHRIVLAAKVSQAWLPAGRNMVAADTGLRARPVGFPWGYAVGATVIVLATAVAGVVAYPHIGALVTVHAGASGVDRQASRSIGSVFAPVFAQLALTVLLVGSARLTMGVRADLDPDRPDDSARRHRHYLALMVRALLLLAVLIDLGLAGLAALVWTGIGSGAALATVVLAPTLIGAVLLIGVSLYAGQGGTRLDGGAPAGTVARDDDALWRGGLVYVNRDDPSILVPKRFGVGWTLNMGHPVGLVVAGVLLILVVGGLTLAVLPH